jgi:hypothetical protein
VVAVMSKTGDLGQSGVETIMAIWHRHSRYLILEI